MINKNEITRIINIRKTLHLDDPQISVLWDDLKELLGKNTEDTIAYLEDASSDEIDWISEVFEDISQQLQSKQLISCLEKLQNKFPNIDIDMDIKFAKLALD